MKTKIFSVLFLMSLMVSAGAAAAISVSEVDYIQDGNNDFYGEDHVIVEFQVDGTGEDVKATVPASELSSTTEADTGKDVTVSADLVDSFAEYNVDDRDLPRIHGIEYVKQEFSSESQRSSFISQSCMDLSEDGDPNTYKWESGFFSTTYGVACATNGDIDTPVYNVGYLQSPPDTMFEAEWTVDVEGESPETAVINNQGVSDGSQERITDNVQIDFIGMRDLGSQAPNPQNTLAAYSSRNGWKLINENDYNDYRDYRSNEALNDLETIATDYRSVDGSFDFKDNAEDDFLSVYEEASSVYSESSISGADELGNSRVENGVFRYSSDSMYDWFVSDFAVRIDGDFVGLEKSFGTPEILSVESEPEVNGLSEDSVEIKVTNDGSGTGFFEPQVDVGEGFELVGTSSGKSFNPGETKSLYATLDADGAESLTVSNTFTVEDRETGESDSVEFESSFEPAEECTPGTQSVRVNSDGMEEIVECGENGVEYNIVETCEEGETAELQNGEYSCVDDEDPIVNPPKGDCQVELFSFGGQSYTVTDPICVLQNWWSDFSFGVGLAVTLLDGLFAFAAGVTGWIVGNKYLGRALELSSATDRPSLKLMVSAGLAVVFAVIAYSLFSQWWVKLLIIIALGLIVYFVAPLISASGVAGALGLREVLE